MICDRCGRNNPENLAFCQDCGRRLASPAGLVPPTPPVGLGVVPLPGDYGAEAAMGGRSRPEAPAFSFESRDEEGPEPWLAAKKFDDRSELQIRPPCPMSLNAAGS